MNIVILRIGHRPERDARITTHVGLVARALGAEGMLLAGSDKNVVESIEKVRENWGGNFTIEHEVNWKQAITHWKRDGGKLIHLTMYGINLPEVLPEINPNDKLMIVVGAEKVPPELYQLADWNIAVGNHPHSEIAALAILLDRLNAKKGSDPLTQEQANGKLKIIPQKHGKKVINNEQKE
jgi:tRNA (cytidine56-2'-O)-methyltransferase